jgi:polar amino acid transport system substrate-binding protein
LKLRKRAQRQPSRAGEHPHGQQPEGTNMSLNRRRLLLLAAAIGIAAGPATAYAADVLNVGAYPTNPPFEFKNTSGTFEGFEVDIVNEAAKRVGMTTDIADLGFQALFAAVSSGRIDVAISSITITPERLKTLSFTQPYYDSDMGIATKTDSAIKAEADLKGKVVGVLSGSTGETWVNAHKDSDGFADVKGYDTQQNLLLDLSAGRIDAAVSDIPGMEYSFKQMKDLVVKERIKTGEQYGLMLAKDSPMLGKLNDALTAMKKDGTLAAIHKKWFGTDAPGDSSTIKEMPIPKA